MKKRNVFFLIAFLSFTASSVFKINNHPIIDNAQKELSETAESQQEELVYLQLDRTFYKPGETIWYKAYIRSSDHHTTAGVSEILNVELIRPNGTIASEYEILCPNGEVYSFVTIPKDKGGIYTLKAYTNWQKNEGTFFKKEIQVQNVVLPNLNMTLDFEKEAYGAGDKVIASLALENLDNSPFRFATFDFKVSLSGKEKFDLKGKTDFDGKAKIEFNLPDSLDSGDGLLNVLIPYRGLTESISRSIPIVMENIDLAFFPEGGDLIERHVTAVAFEALNEYGKPADVEGEIRNKKGNVVAQFSSLHKGMGKFVLLPANGDSYTANITKPTGIATTFQLPSAKEQGVMMNVTHQNSDYMLVNLKSNQKENVHLIAQSGDSIYYARSLEFEDSENVRINTKDFPMGICRLTIFNDQEIALGERLVFLNKHKKLKIEIKTNKETYLPREKVEVGIKVTDEDGKGVSGSFSMSVSDDKLLTYADDKQGHILSKVFLEHELKGEIYEPNFYFDEEEELADEAMDLLMMVRGWRRFEWKEVQEDHQAPIVFQKEKMTISGQVLDSTGLPVIGALVSNTTNNRKDTTDENGRYLFDKIDIPHNGYIFQASLGNYEIGRIGISKYGYNFNFKSAKIKGHVRGFVYNQKEELCGSCEFLLADERGVQFKYKTDKYGAYSVYNLVAGQYTSSLLSQDSVLATKALNILPLRNNYINLEFFEKIKKDSEVDGLSISENTINSSKFYSDLNADLNPERVKKEDIQRSERTVFYTTPNPKVDIVSNELRTMSMSMSSNSLLCEVIVMDYKVPLIEQDKTMSGGTITSEEIRNLASKNVSSLAAITAGLSQIDEGESVHIRGSRASATNYYIDGIRVSAANLIPQSEIDHIQVISGGLPASYSGGVANIIPGNRRTKGKIPEDPDPSLAEEILYQPESGGSANIISSYSHRRVGSSYRTYKRPKAIMYLPSKSALYNKNCKECEGLNKEDTQVCHDEILIKRVNTQFSYYLKSHVSIESNVVNVEFVVDKHGYIGDFKIKGENELDNARNRNNFYWVKYALRQLNGWKAAKNNGLKVGARYNIQLHLDEFGKRKKAKQYFQQKTFYNRNYNTNQKSKVRNDFRSTVHWDPTIKTNEKGEASVTFWNGDDLTKYNITVEGFGDKGIVGRGENDYAIQTPFSIIAKVPETFAYMDTIKLPVTLTNNSKRKLSGKLKVKLPAYCYLLSSISDKIIIEPKESKSLFLKFYVKKSHNYLTQNAITISFETNRFYDAFSKQVKLISRGFPHHYTYTDVGLENEFDIEIKDTYNGTIKANFKAHASPVSELASGMEKIIRQPYGCFEQTSSTNYPNILALELMQKTGVVNPAIQQKATKFLEFGYNRLSGFEVKNGGFSLYGRSPARERLSAYGLMQFVDMAKVYPVDQKIIDRTANWLIKQRESSGGWGASRYYRSNTPQMNAYILWAICEAGYGNKMKKEIELQYKNIATENDPYLTALMANILAKTNDPRSESYIDRLIGLQKDNGGWAGAKFSGTYSYGQTLEIETTALALLALSRSNEFRPKIERKAQHFLLKSKNQYGYGSTQSTILTLKAIIASMDRFDKEESESGIIELIVDGIKVKEFSYQRNQKELLAFMSISELQKDGKHKVAVNFKNTKHAIPFELEIKYNSKTGQKNSVDCPIELKTTWSDLSSKMGETVRLASTIQNLTADTVAQPLAIIGIPGGLTVQPWQLKELQDKGVVEYYEMERDRVVFYLGHMGPLEEKIVNLDLKADVPGIYQSPASQAYLYYNNEAVSWVLPEVVRVGE